MTLYHFTAERFLNGIKREGLTRGHMLASLKPVRLIANKQWLTSNAEFSQSWLNPRSILPYKRNEIRLKIIIPDQAKDNCRPWSQMKFLVPDVAQDLSAFGDPENWYIYDGHIPPTWIESVELNPQESEPK